MAFEAVAMACEAELQERTAGAAYEAEQGCLVWSILVHWSTPSAGIGVGIFRNLQRIKFRFQRIQTEKKLLQQFRAEDSICKTKCVLFS